MWRILKKLEIELPYDPAIPLLGIHTEETKSERDTCTPMFIAALFIIARTWNQPSADEWIRKLWYVYTMEYYSAVKNNSFVSVLMRWMKLEPIIQSEVSQKDKDQYSILTHICGIRKMVRTTLYAKQKKRHRYIEHTFGLSGRRRGWDVQENRIKTCILSKVKQITSPGWMHETSVQTWCTGKTQRDWVEREVRGVIRMVYTCKSMADSCQCMTKNTTIF